MDLFQKAKKVRLRSVSDKYLTALDDEETVCQARDGSTENALWEVDFLEGETFLRFKSCYGKYLTASSEPFLPGVTGKKVIQMIPTNMDESGCTDWEPLRDGFQVRLRTRKGNFLRPNGGLPPWRNSVTHDIPHRSKTHEKVLWDVEVAETIPLNHKSNSGVKLSKSRSTCSSMFSGSKRPNAGLIKVTKLEDLI